MRILEGKDVWTYIAELETREIDLDVHTAAVRPILERVRLEEDDAVEELLKEIYGLMIRREEFRVSEDLIDDAVRSIGEDLRYIEELASRIRSFYELQLPRDVIVERGRSKYGIRWVPLDSVGIHVPQYPKQSSFSILLFTAVPAKVAGVREVLVFTPPLPNGEVDPYLLAAARVAEVDGVYRVGGAVAVAAMAYGTTTIPQVRKIFGTGDMHFMTAKRLVSPDVEIDFPSWPVEHIVIAGRGADPELVAWDLVSQAEHGVETLVLAMTTDRRLAEEIAEDIERIRGEVERSIASHSLEDLRVLVLGNWEEVAEAVEAISPARISIFGNAELEDLRNVGAVLWNTPSPIADYGIGTPQRLPSSRYSRFRGPLTIMDFMKPQLQVRLEGSELEDAAALSARLADLEGLPLHSKFADSVVR